MNGPVESRPIPSELLLKELHILTRDGRLNQDSRRKLKQVNHLVQFIEPLMREVLVSRGDLTLVDHGAGKSYLGFILYDLVLKAGDTGHIHGVEQRPELVARSAALAQRLDFSRMHFHELDCGEAVQSGSLPERVDIVSALHACDTATDDAIRFALERQSPFIVLVPCCQAEVAAALRAGKGEMLARTSFAELWRHPIHTREFGSHLTNVLRCLLLEAHGYQLSVTELVGWEHSMKNELIIARRTGCLRGNARERASEMLDVLGLDSLKSRFLY